jgi:hypothetical protein
MKSVTFIQRIALDVVVTVFDIPSDYDESEVLDAVQEFPFNVTVVQAESIVDGYHVHTNAGITVEACAYDGDAKVIEVSDAQ